MASSPAESNDGPVAFEQLEAALQALLCRAAPLTLHVAHFVYAGELEGSGMLARLQRSVPQRALPPKLLEAILDEADTQQRLRALLDLLERAIGGVAALGGGARASERAECPLHRYALDSLLLSSYEWARASTPTLEQHACLCHLQCLLVALEAGSASERLPVSPLYCEPLPKELEEALAADPRLVASELLPIVHDFLRSQLLEGSWPADANLKEFLTYSTEVDVEQWAWFRDDFPESLQLRHSFALYELLRQRQ